MELISHKRNYDGGDALEYWNHGNIPNLLTIIVEDNISQCAGKVKDDHQGSESQ
jgi:hypothetical protein